MLKTIGDASLLLAISIPLIYAWLIKPIVVASDAALSQANVLAETDPVSCHRQV
ncbi:MAG: hypothetical protein ACOH1I_09825 [Gallionellaceae bacterium]